MKSIIISPANLAVLASERPPNLEERNALFDPAGPIWRPLDYKAAFTMKKSVEIGVGQTAYHSVIRWRDLPTVEKLAAKGYILAKPREKIFDDEISSTDASLIVGSDLMKRRRDFQSRL